MVAPSRQPRQATEQRPTVLTSGSDVGDRTAAVLLLGNETGNYSMAGEEKLQGTTVTKNYDDHVAITSCGFGKITQRNEMNFVADAWDVLLDLNY
jgi:hypothetical protein